MNILILDDEQGFRDELNEFLGTAGNDIFPAARPSEAFQVLNKYPIDLAILDIRLPEMDGLQVLKEVKTSFPHIEVIMITGHGDMDSVIKAMKEGAIDFFNKPFKLKDIQRTIEKTKNHIQLNRNLKVSNNGYSLISKELEEKIGFSFISKNSIMKTVVQLMHSVAKSSHTTVLITGESGTGKEVVARGIHYLSERAGQALHSVNCSTIPDELFESEFFGHKKGSFTSAINHKKGLFEVADKGTLFLDEIADLKVHHQPKFLRVLDNKMISRLGETAENRVDVRIIAATNYDLRQLVEEKKFRSDLFYRLNSFVIHIPPLRERIDDIPLLLDYFIKQFSGQLRKKIRRVDKSVIEHLIQHDFPGNVRELKHMIEKAVILCNGDKLCINHFPDILQQSFTSFIHKNASGTTYHLEQIERNTITLALQQTNYNKSKTAKLLHISRQALDRKLQRLNINIQKSPVL
ncbi:MAG: sigma-54 dependent transcriptional regulator [Bacteroidales bacterium]|nr:sigma-54 dependent transcriptional regulator [Bacteroidales bacterium]MCF6342368.1 sigma-54 dependent transcriptional regulator [Bacteroidales bacterium]